MLLQRCINSQVKSFRWLAKLLLCTIVAAGCASSPSSEISDRQVDEESVPAADREVPSEATIMYERAVAIMASGDILDAQLRFQEFLLQYPDYPGAHVNLAIIFATNNDDAAAENSLTDALIIDPQHPAALNQLGMLLRRQGQFPQAESAYLKAVTAHPDYALAHYNLGVLNELYLQNFDSALQHYESYQALAGEDAQVKKWISDLKRRIDAAQRTANVTE